MKTLFVTGTDTGVGKTWVSCLLIRQLRSCGLRVGAYKPVCSGASVDPDGNLLWDDVESLSRACGSNPPLDLVCPQRFVAPVAPNVAARLQGARVDDRLLSTGIDNWRTRVDWLIVEGVGGLYCPLSDARVVADLALELYAPVVVVAANRLGVISHTRLTVAALKSLGLPLASIVLNEVQAPSQSECPSPDQDAAASNADQLRYWIPDVSLLHCAWQAESLTVLSKPPGELSDCFCFCR